MNTKFVYVSYSNSNSKETAIKGPKCYKFSIPFRRRWLVAGCSNTLSEIPTLRPTLGNFVELRGGTELTYDRLAISRRLFCTSFCTTSGASSIRFKYRLMLRMCRSWSRREGGRLTPSGTFLSDPIDIEDLGLFCLGISASTRAGFQRFGMAVVFLPFDDFRSPAPRRGSVGTPGAASRLEGTKPEAKNGVNSG